MQRQTKSLTRLWLVGVVTAAAAPQRVIIDQDTTGPGTTNTNSIALLLCAPGLQVEGITVATGDGWLGEEVAHVLRLLELINRTDVPVYAGSTGPLLPTSLREIQAREALHGSYGWYGAWERGTVDPHYVNASHFPEGLPQHKTVEKIPAAEFIVQTVRAHPGAVSILALAPLTNIASAMAVEPRLPSLAKEIVLMGGAVACTITDTAHCDQGPPWHEFNFWFDPHAARRVLRSVAHVTGNWSSMRMLPADVASQPLWSGRLQSAVRAKQASSAVAAYIATYTFASPDVAYPLFDELTALYFLSCRDATGSSDDRRLSQTYEMAQMRARDQLASCALVDGAREVFADVSIDAATPGMLLTWPTAPSGMVSKGKGYAGPRLGEKRATLYLGHVNLDVLEQQLLALL